MRIIVGTYGEKECRNRLWEFFIMRIIVGTDGGNVCKAKNRW